MRVDAIAQERYWYPDDGGEVWVAGFQLVAPDGRYLARDAPELESAGLLVAGVAGARDHHNVELQSPAAAPGAPLTLRRDRANPHDANAIAVHVADGAQLGFVQRPTPRDPRTGVTMLIAPGEALELIVRSG
jgi:hypothetical protein